MLCLYSFTDKPWVVSFTDANLLATIGGLGMGIVFWFTWVEAMSWAGSRLHLLSSNDVGMFSLCAGIRYLSLLNTQEQGNYQVKTWHLSEAAVFFMFLPMHLWVQQSGKESKDKRRRG